jgi:hypothetical protein
MLKNISPFGGVHNALHAPDLKIPGMDFEIKIAPRPPTHSPPFVIHCSHPPPWQAIYGNPHQRKADLVGAAFPGSELSDGEAGASTSVLSADLLLMGIMASDVRLAMRGFRDWCQALGVEFVMPENRVSERVTWW